MNGSLFSSLYHGIIPDGSEFSWRNACVLNRAGGADGAPPERGTRPARGNVRLAD